MSKVSEIVLTTVKDMNRDLGLGQFRNPTLETPLYGDDSELDSLSLVMLVGETEARINDEFGSSIVIASEKALSLRNSPFRSIGALSEFITQELSAS